MMSVMARSWRCRFTLGPLLVQNSQSKIPLVNLRLRGHPTWQSNMLEAARIQKKFPRTRQSLQPKSRDQLASRSRQNPSEADGPHKTFWWSFRYTIHSILKNIGLDSDAHQKPGQGRCDSGIGYVIVGLVSGESHPNQYSQVTVVFHSNLVGFKLECVI
jgi:hypothetical protein